MLNNSCEEIPEAFLRNERIVLVCPFTSRVILDEISLASKYNSFRLHLYHELEKKYGDSLFLEMFSYLSEDKYDAAYKNWLKPIREDNNLKTSKRKKRKTSFEAGVGKTLKDKSIFTLRPNKEFIIEINRDEYDFLDEAPTVIIKEVSFHEYGVGMLLCDMYLSKNEKITHDEICSPKTLIINCASEIMRCPEIESWLDQLDSDFAQITDKIRKTLELGNSMFSYKDIYFNDTPSVILWTQTIFRFDGDEQLKDWILHHAVEVSHPDGPIDYFKGRRGFVHIGWQTSLIMDLIPAEEKFMYEGLRHAEIEWRTLSKLTELLTTRMKEYVNLDDLNMNKIERKLEWINDLRLEMDLYTANQQNLVQNMNPAAYFVYKHTKEAWRIEQMQQFFEDKLEAFDVLYQTGLSEVEKKNNQIVNNILFAFTVVSIVSVIIDSVYFINPDITALTTPIARVLMLLSTPLTIVVILLLIFRLRSQQRKVK